MSEERPDDGDSDGDGSGQPGGQGQAGGQTQPAGQPQQPAGQSQGQPAGQAATEGGQPQGQYGAAAASSPTDILSEPAGQEVIKYVVVLFAAIGGAVGVMGMLASSLLNGSSFGSSAALSSYSMLLFAGGPLLAAVLSLQGVFAIGETEKESYVLAIVSGAAGHIVLTFVGGVFAAIAVSFFPFGDALVAGIFMAIATGLVAAAVMWAEDWSDLPA